MAYKFCGDTVQPIMGTKNSYFVWSSDVDPVVIAVFKEPALRELTFY